MIYEIDLLDGEALLWLQDNLKNLEYVDGNISNPSPKKRCKMACDGKLYEKINQQYSGHINKRIYSIYNIRRTSQLYFLEYNEGAFYDYHIDNIPCGGVFPHYSMTCFLNNPSEYEGGELVLKIGNTEVEYKLEAGKAIMYPTGLWHKVNKVQSGSRKVFVCWAESIVHDTFMRNYLSEFAQYICEADISKEVQEKLDQFRINLLREYGKI